MPTRPPFHCFETPIWLSWRLVHTLHTCKTLMGPSLSFMWRHKTSEISSVCYCWVVIEYILGLVTLNILWFAGLIFLLTICCFNFLLIIDFDWKEMVSSNHVSLLLDINSYTCYPMRKCYISTFHCSWSLLFSGITVAFVDHSLFDSR